MPDADEPLARVVLIGGASGSGKSRIAEQSGLPVLRLDDFYREGDDPARAVHGGDSTPIAGVLRRFPNRCR